MGCISSKVIARSISFNEERKQGSARRSANGIPLLEDLIISGANGTDQYLALLRAANTVVSNKLHSRSSSSTTSRKLVVEPLNSEITEESELSARQSQEVVGKQIESHNNNNNRSNSWHWFPENLTEFDDKHNMSSKVDIGSRSFHTVEEYDDLVNKIRRSKSAEIQHIEFNDEECDASRTIEDLQVSEFVHNTTHHSEDNDSATEKMQPPSSHNQCSSEESKTVKEISIQSTAPESNKRKAIAKRIGSLGIPSSNIECASLREWLPASGIYSPGSYVTPKFGSYSLMDIRNNGNESGEDLIFSPELVSAFEECMQELEAEEESILKQIIEDVEEETGEFS